MKLKVTLLTALLLAPLFALHAADRAKRKPNIIVILADDLLRDSATFFVTKFMPAPTSETA